MNIVFALLLASAMLVTLLAVILESIEVYYDTKERMTNED
jgi:hypothetical protein|tara:strand:+ start:349 stop:468 length:120 start_codon:yes stop_codon:yes gene_type:complete